MSQTVDNRVVQMQFNNSQFEKGANQSLNTIDKLNSSLNSMGTNNGFQKLNSSANSVSFDNIENGVSSLQKRFSALGIAGMTVVTDVTRGVEKLALKMTSALVSGGRQRSLNIEQAKFQFQGLGMNVEKTMASALDAVHGTAYGLDEAAKVASMLGASGMRAGKKMTSSLRAVAGVAAMTGSSYSQIGDIFTTVAGNGRLMGEQLLQLSGRGINAAATLGKYLHKSEKQVREMVSEGKISFQTFSDAMDSAFGQHAKDANKTFEGSLSNVRAALARIGADFFTPYFENMKNVNNALIPLIDNVHTALLPVITLISKLMKLVGDAMVKQLTAVAKAVADLTGKFKMNSRVMQNLKNTFEGFVSLIHIIWTVVKGLATVLFSLVKSLLPVGNGLLEVTGNLGVFIKGIDKSVDKSKAFVNIADKISNALKGVGKVSESIGKALVKVFKAVGTYIGKFFDKMVSVFTDIDKAATLFNAAGLASMLATFGIILSNLSNPLNDLHMTLMSFRGIALRVKGTLATAKTSLLALQSTLNATALKSLAEAIALLAVSLWVLASVDPKKLVSAVAGLQAAALILSDTMIIIKKLELTDVKGIWGFTNAMISLSLALLIMATAVKKLSSLNWNQLAKGLVGLAGVSAVMVGLEKGLSKVDKVGAGAAKMVVMAGAIYILAGALTKIGALKFKDILKGVAGLGMVMGEMAAFVALTSGVSSGILKGVGMIAMAEAMNILYKAVSKFASLKVDALQQGLKALGIALLELAGFAALTNGTGGTFILVAAGMLIMSKALDSLVKSVDAFGSMDPDQMVQGLIGLAGALGAVSVAAASMSGALIGAVAIAIICKSLINLTSVIKTIGSLKFEVLLQGLLGLAAALGVIGAAAAVMLPVIPAMLALGAAIALFGGGIALLGVGLTSLGAGMVSFTTGLVMFTTQVVANVEMIIKMFKDMGVGIANGLFSFITTLADKAPALNNAMFTIFSNALDVINQLVPKIVEVLINIIDKFLASLADHMPSIVQSGISIVQGLIDGIAQGLPKLINAAFNLVISLINGLADAIRQNAGPLRDAIVNLLTSMVDAALTFLGIKSPSKLFAKIGGNIVLGLIEGIGSHVAGAVSAIASWMAKMATAAYNGAKTMVSKALKAVKEGAKDFETAGINAAKGFAKGIGEKVESAVTAAKNLGSKAWKALKHILDEHSPSKITTKIGKFFGEGYVNGMLAYTDKAYSAAADIAKSSSDGLNDALAVIGVDSNPTITPVLDLSNVKSGADALSNMLPNGDTIGITANANAVTSSLGGIQNGANTGSDIVSAIDGLRQAISESSGNTYNVNGVTYDDGSNITEAVKTLVKATVVEKRL